MTTNNDTHSDLDLNDVGPTPQDKLDQLLADIKASDTPSKPD